VVQRRFAGDLADQTFADVHTQLVALYDNVPAQWKVQQLMAAPTEFKTLADVAAALRPAPTPKTGTPPLAIAGGATTPTTPTTPTAAPKAPSTPALKQLFAQAVVTATTLGNVQATYSLALGFQRRLLWQDDALMAKAKAALSAADYLRVMADLGVYRPDGTVAHATAKKADAEIQATFKDFVGDAVRAGKKVEGNVVVLTGQDWFDAYYHEFPGEAPRDGPTDEEPRTNAFTTTKPPVNVIVLNKDKGNPATTIHEGLHLYQHDAVLNACGTDFNEGVTELLTRQVSVPLGIARANYENQHGAMVEVATHLGMPKLKAAYFQGQVAELQAAFVAFRTGKGDSAAVAAGRWTTLLRYFREGRYDRAKEVFGWRGKT